MYSQDSFPNDLEVPVKLSEACAYILYNIVNVEVYLVRNNLVYTVHVQLVMDSVFTVLKILPFPMQKKGVERKYTLIQPEKQFID